MKIIVIKGAAQAGKSSMIRGALAGAQRDGIAACHHELSSAMVKMVNRAFELDPVSTEQLIQSLHTYLAASIGYHLGAKAVTIADDMSQFVRDIAWRDLLDARRSLQDWFPRVGPDFRLNELNKDDNRIVLTWLALYGRYVTRDESVFTLPVLSRLEADSHTGIEYGFVGGLRYPAELEAFRRHHDVVGVMEVRSRRRPTDSDPANAKREGITPTAIYYADFPSPDASERFSRDVLWPDLARGVLQSEYRPAA